MSMKYWEMEVQEDIFSMVMPLIKQSIEELSPTMDLWSSCFSRIFHNRDPNTMEKLYNYLSDWTLHDVTFSTVLQRKTHFLCQSMLSNHWKLAELNKHILTKVTPFLDNPYQSFREAIAKLLYIIFLPDVEFNNVHSTRSPHAAQFFNDVLLPRLKFLNSPKQNIDDEEYKKNKLLLKTVCCWLNMASLCQRIWPEAYQLVGILCQTRRNDLNSETSVLCTKSLNFLAKNVHTKSHFLKTFDYIYFVFTNDNLSSNAKISLLQFTQVFVFHNIPYLFSDNNRISKISDVIVNFLFDLDVDVKHATRAVLRDFLRCNMSDVQVLIDRFTQGCSKPVISNKKESISTIQGNILGLLAVIDASPYEIPDYIVNILETLSQHLMDPHPIPNWIATAVDNFRHTQPNKLLLIEKVPSDLLQLLSGSKLTYYS
ncbi:proteasome activator complex subunit 4A-like isoform X2 [Cimex lectularius]|nr:proteasome activator complex subunit 4A-like isoform X2 [Cimex lectularius]